MHITVGHFKISISLSSIFLNKMIIFMQRESIFCMLSYWCSHNIITTGGQEDNCNFHKQKSLLNTPREERAQIKVLRVLNLFFNHSVSIAASAVGVITTAILTGALRSGTRSGLKIWASQRKKRKKKKNEGEAMPQCQPRGPSRAFPKETPRNTGCT